eukprot:11055412-Alexandrium_andersonii.AAC.1
MQLGERARLLLLQFPDGAVRGPAIPRQATALLEEEGVVALALTQPLDGAREHRAHGGGDD